MSDFTVGRSQGVGLGQTQMMVKAIAPLALLAGALLPLFLTGSIGLTLGMQVMVLAVFAYSYQVLYGLANLLSFGHAVYFGIGGFIAAHAMNSTTLASAHVPIEAVPLFGLAGGALLGVVLGYPTSRSSGTPFAMVTLGIGELVGACFLMFPVVFGGESGISTDRGNLPSIFGGVLGTTRQLYPIVVAWTILLVAVALWIRRTPLGLLARAIRNNDERVSFLGFDPSGVRLRVIVLSSMLAAGAGALSAMVYEIVSVEAVSIHTSANVLIMTVVGGAASVWGPLIGALLLTFMQTVLSGVTVAWPMYYGLLFVAIILKYSNGLTDPLLRATLRKPKALAKMVAFVVVTVAVVEMLYRAHDGGELTLTHYAAVALLIGFALVSPSQLLKRIGGAS